MNIESIPLASLTLDPKNARRHSRRNLDATRDSLKRFGQQKPIVVDAGGVIRAGNGTVIAARELGWTHIEAVRTQLTETEAIAYGVADNRTAELGEWDPDVLLALDVDLSSLAFSEADVAELRELATPAEAVGGAAAARSSDRGKRIHTKPTIRIVLAFDDLKEFETALASTGKMNRSEAVLTLCRTYGGTKGQLDVPAQGGTAAAGAGGAGGDAGRARKSRRARQAV